VKKSVTTSGTWPELGSVRVSSHQKVRVELEKAANHLHLTDTTGWIATVAGREINIQTSYEDNGLTGTIVIDFGPREGGGGNE
jgi:hypothetical protein